METQTPQIKAITPRKRRGIFGSTSSTITTLLETVDSTAEALSITLEIANVSLRESLADTYANAIIKLVELGYSQEEAQKALEQRR